MKHQQHRGVLIRPEAEQRISWVMRAILITGAFSHAASVEAASASWNTGDGDWNSGANWSPTSAPGVPGTATGNLDVATFGTVGTTAHGVTDAEAARMLGQISFTGTGTGGSHTIGSSSNTIYFNDYSPSTTGNILLSASAPSQTIASNLMATGANGVTANDLRITTANGYSGTLTLSGNISTASASGTSGMRIITSGSTSSANSNNQVHLSGVISDGTSGGKLGISRGRNGIVLITGANTFSGGFVQGADSSGSDTIFTVTRIGVASVFSGSTLVSGPFGTGTLTLWGGKISSDGTTARTIGNALAFSIGVTLGDAVNNGALTFTGSGSFNTGMTFNVGSDVTMTGVLGGTNMGKSGAGKLTLTGANTYTGNTTISNGRLALKDAGNIDSSSGISIATGAKLDTTAKAGTYSPASAQPITFSLNAAGGGSSGQIDAASLVISDASVSFNISGTLDDPEYVLVSYTGTLTGSFSASPPTGYDFDYGTRTNSQIKLVPAEPSGFADWASVNGATGQEVSDDHDNDGMDNGTEYFIGGPTADTTGFTANPGPDGTNKVTWPNGAGLPVGDYGVTGQYVVQTSTDLVNWSPVPDDNSDPNLDVLPGSVSYTINGAGKQFVRLKVTPD